MKSAKNYDALSLAFPDERAIRLRRTGASWTSLSCAYGLGIDSNEFVASDFLKFHVPEINHFIAHPFGFETAPETTGG